MSLLAQFATPPEGLSSGYFSPLILAGLVYAGLFVAARVFEGREQEARSETMEDLGFGVILLAGLYVAILAVVAVASEFDLVWDLLRIMVVVVAFFLVLVLLLLLVFEVLVRAVTPGSGGRRGGGSS